MEISQGLLTKSIHGIPRSTGIMSYYAFQWMVFKMKQQIRFQIFLSSGFAQSKLQFLIEPAIFLCCKESIH